MNDVNNTDKTQANINKQQTENSKQFRRFYQKQQVLMSLGEEYTIKVVNGNYELISKMFKAKTFKKSEYNIEELRFIKDVRKHVIKSEVYLEPRFQEHQVFSEDVHYVKVSRVPVGQLFKNVCEVDIDQAYWETAYQLGIVDDKLYQRGSKGNISKKARLTALGSLARKTYNYKFQGDKLLETIVDREPLLENIWFTICKRVSDVMHEVIAELGKDFIFYWVDGIYMVNSPENVQKAMGIFIKNGYNSKFKKINQILFHEKGFVVNDYGEIKREFAYPNYAKKNGAKINYSRNFRAAKMANKIINDELDLSKETD
jgi:hypothetical protein